MDNSAFIEYILKETLSLSLLSNSEYIYLPLILKWQK